MRWDTKIVYLNLGERDWTLLDSDLVEDWFELVFVEGGGCPRDDPVYPVRLVQAVDGALLLVSPELGLCISHKIQGNIYISWEAFKSL